MRRLAGAWWVIGIAACTGGEAPTSAKAPVEAKTDVEAKKVDDAKKPAGKCDERIADYLAARAELGTCEQDSDCAEMWPGLCPHGPYYTHREGDVAPVLAMELAIMKECSVPDCEPPMELGIAHCEAGKCTKGRAAAKGPCWDFRETNLEADGATDATTVAKVSGKTPHVVIAPAKPGTLVLEVDWPTTCSDCKLLVSEHNSGMARLVSAKSTSSKAERNGAEIRRERLELKVTPGPYHMIATAKTDASYILHATLTTDDGTPATVTRHGTDWQRICED